MVQPEQKPSMRRQCELLSVCRSSLYYEPEPIDEEQLELMRLLDELHLRHPFYGSRSLTLELKKQGKQVNRKRVQRLMRLMGLESMAPKPKTSRPSPQHPVYPYLLRGLEICRVNQVWAADISVPQKAA
jgi:putative transposase